MEVSLDPDEILQKEYDLENRRTRLFAYYKKYAWRKKNYI